MRAFVNLSIANRMNIGHRKLSQRKIIAIRDPVFPAATEDFFRLHAKFPLPDELEAELSLISFGDASKDIMNAVCRENPNKYAAELWEFLNKSYSTERSKGPRTLHFSV